MVIDSSVLVAIAFNEPERLVLSEAIYADAVRLVGAPTRLETAMVVLGRQGEDGLVQLKRFLQRTQIDTVSFGSDHSELALTAFRRFGKGRHPAALNLGDCFSYALSKATGEPLLFKGEDFARTDVTAAAW